MNGFFRLSVVSLPFKLYCWWGYVLGSPRASPLFLVRGVQPKALTAAVLIGTLIDNAGCGVPKGFLCYHVFPPPPSTHTSLFSFFFFSGFFFSSPGTPYGFLGGDGFLQQDKLLSFSPSGCSGKAFEPRMGGSTLCSAMLAGAILHSLSSYPPVLFAVQTPNFRPAWSGLTFTPPAFHRSFWYPVFPITLVVLFL